MKIILALAMIIGMTLSAATTLGSKGTNAWTIAYTANSSNSSNTDVVFAITATTAPTATNALYLSCADTGVANFTLSAATTTGKVGFGISLVTTAADILKASITATAYKLSVAYATAGTWTAGVSNKNVSGGTYASTSKTAATLKFSAMTPTQLTALGLPNTSETFYWQCYSSFDLKAVDFSSSTAVVISTFGNGKTVKFGSSSGSYMGFFASGAIATTTAILALF